MTKFDRQLEKLYFLDQTPFDAKHEAIGFISDIVVSGFNTGRPEIVNDLIIEYDPTKYSYQVSVGLLEACKSLKFLLPNWDRVVKRIKKHFDNKGLDTDLLLEDVLREQTGE
jgi:hypothetical protein